MCTTPRVPRVGTRYALASALRSNRKRLPCSRSPVLLPCQASATIEVKSDVGPSILRSVHVPDDDRWPAHFRGLGIQVEDSVAIGDEHPLVLSVEAPKEVVDIEALRGEMLEMEKVQKL